MILEKDQIYRYLRHIIMPEVSGTGQKKLLEASIDIYCESLKAAAPMLYYLAASGIGHISCLCEDMEGSSTLYANISDLNPNIEIKMVDKLPANGESSMLTVFFGSSNSVTRHYGNFIKNLNESEFKPSIVALKDSWNGFVGLFSTLEALDAFMAELSTSCSTGSCHEEKAFSSTCLLGTLSAVEVIKICLGLAPHFEMGTFFDLYNMEFDSFSCTSAKSYIDKLAMVQTQVSSLQPHNKNLSEARVLIVGTGGLGSPAAYALAMSGIGTIGLVDYDIVEISNLNRQMLHSTSRIGMPKTESAGIFLEKLSPSTHIIKHNVNLSSENVMDIIEDYDIIIDGVDNLPTRYMLNDACYFQNKPLIEAGVLRFDGLAVTILPGQSTCYRCIFPEEFAGGDVPSCSESGVLGPIPGVMGFIQAAEAVKLLSGEGVLLTDKILLYNGLESDFSIPQYERESNCALCGVAPTIKELGYFSFVCESKQQ